MKTLQNIAEMSRADEQRAAGVSQGSSVPVRPHEALHLCSITAPTSAKSQSFKDIKYSGEPKTSKWITTLCRMPPGISHLLIASLSHGGRWRRPTKRPRKMWAAVGRSTMSWARCFSPNTLRGVGQQGLLQASPPLEHLHPDTGRISTAGSQIKALLSWTVKLQWNKTAWLFTLSLTPSFLLCNLLLYQPKLRVREALKQNCKETT